MSFLKGEVLEGGRPNYGISQINGIFEGGFLDGINKIYKMGGQRKVLTGGI
jgi:hypothetical protein